MEPVGPAGVSRRRHAVFAGSHPAQRCSPDHPSVQAMMQQQSLAVADLALRMESDAKSMCTSSSSPIQLPNDNKAATCLGRHQTRMGAPGGVDGRLREDPGDSRRLCVSAPQVHVLAGHRGEDVEIQPHMLRLWDRVRIQHRALVTSSKAAVIA